MRLRALALLGGALAVSLGCQPPRTVTGAPAAPTDPPAARESVSPDAREMAALAFLAYLGEKVEGSDDEVERQLVPCMEGELARQPLTRDKWSLAWGPAVFKFALAELDDNMMYVVRETANPGHLAIAVRGTNSTAILDWLVEDFEVFRQVSWPYGEAPADAKIAHGTYESLQILQNMVPVSGPSAGQTLSQFLTAEAQAHGALLIDVTGHSLGGALSPTLALWLADTQPQWDPAGTARLRVFPLAGPTAGNAAFAAYSDARIGAAVDRLHNPLDVVPLAWNHQTMSTTPDLYEPLTRASLLERGALDVVLELTKSKGYTQIVPDAPPLQSALNDGDPSFLGQVGWQHTCGYHCAIGLVEPTFLPITVDCKTDPANPCPVCPSG